MNTTMTAIVVTCRQMPTLTRHPKLVLTALVESPSPEKSFEKEFVSWMRGRSSATTQRVLTQLRLTPLLLSKAIEVPSPFVQSSITP